jgi:DNA-binding MarR family transcriptional regulator
MYTHTRMKPIHSSILKIIARYQERTRNSPSYEEIAMQLGVSKACVAGNIRQMSKAGLLKRSLGSRRCIVITTSGKARVA